MQSTISSRYLDFTDISYSLKKSAYDDITYYKTIHIFRVNYITFQQHNNGVKYDGR